MFSYLGFTRFSFLPELVLLQLSLFDRRCVLCQFLLQKDVST
ncbi:hypothetical protein AAZV13_05G145400 [Glycine max]